MSAATLESDKPAHTTVESRVKKRNLIERISPQTNHAVDR